MEHFQDLTTNDLLKDDNGNITESLVNVIRMNNPIVVVDEAHNAGTPLSGNMFADFKPCFILEYTATPKPDSNILVNITAQQLKEESMIKIPIYLKNIAQWQATIRDGTAKRNHLEDLSKKIKNEYIRPIALIQAEQEKENPDKIHVRKIKRIPNLGSKNPSKSNCHKNRQAKRPRRNGSLFQKLPHTIYHNGAGTKKRDGIMHLHMF